MYGRTSIYAHRRKNRKKAILSFFIILIAAVLVALGISVYWEKSQQQREDALTAETENNADAPKEVPTEQPEGGNGQPEGDGQSEQEAAVVDTETTEQTEEQESQSTSAVTQTPVENTDVVTMTSQRILDSPALVPNSGFSVSDDYFDDAAFVGDSITEGIKLYEVMSNATVVAARGINLDTVFTDDQIRTSEGYTTALGALEEANPKKIYIMFGANGVGWFTEEHFTEAYTSFVQSVKEQHPDSQIFLQSILPVTQEFDDEREDISNEKINQYNELIVQIAENEDVYYLDVASAIKDENGCLPEDSNGDGMHFGTTYYNKWFDYLKTHTVTEEGQPS